MAYKEPTVWKENGGRVFTNTGQELELLEASDLNAVKYAKSFSRAWLKNGDAFEVVVRINGNIEEIVATGEAKCKTDEVQPLYIKARIEQVCAASPTGPALDAAEVL